MVARTSIKLLTASEPVRTVSRCATLETAPSSKPIAS
jgi:hypothetical protein